MKKILILISLICLCIGIVYVKNTIPDPGKDCEHKINATIVEGKNVFDQKIPDGLVCIYEDGILKLKVNMKDRQANGTFNMYHPNGRIKSEDTAKNGKTEGIFRLYDEKGRLSVEGTNINGKTEGIARAYDKSGRLSEEITYKNGVVDGDYKQYNKNGTLKAQILFRSNIPISGFCAATGKELTSAELADWADEKGASCY